MRIMKSLRLFLTIVFVGALCSCVFSTPNPGYHPIAVAWPPGHENVPDCTPLITMTGDTVDIKGVKVTTPVGVGAEGGEYHKEAKVLQSASDAAEQADQKFTQLCRLLPSYLNDQKGFYRVRDQMFDLIAATNYVASAVAAQTGQTPPVQPTSIPTASTAAAASAGTNPTKAVANPVATTSSAAKSPTPNPSTSPSGSQNLKKAVDRLKALIDKAVPKLPKG